MPQSLQNFNDYNDKGDNSSPVSEKAQNENLNSTLDNLFVKVFDNNFVDTKKGDFEKKIKIHSEALDNSNNSNNNKQDRNCNHNRVDNNNNRSTSSSDSKEICFHFGWQYGQES